MGNCLLRDVIPCKIQSDQSVSMKSQSMSVRLDRWRYIHSWHFYPSKAIIVFRSFSLSKSEECNEVVEKIRDISLFFRLFSYRYSTRCCIIREMNPSETYALLQATREQRRNPEQASLCFFADSCIGTFVLRNFWLFYLITFY